MSSRTQEVVTENPNEQWLYARGMSIAYLTTVLIVHLALISIPFISTEDAWTLTNALHSLVTFIFFHWKKGAPVELYDDGTTSTQTLWEQIEDHGSYSVPRRFLIAFPIALFILTTFYTHHDEFAFLLNLLFLAIAVIPKLPIFDGVRLFNINKY